MTQSQQNPHHKDSDTAHMGAIAFLSVALDRLRGDQDNVATPDLADAGHSDPNEAETKKDDKGPRTTLGALLDELDERAYGLMFLILALPCCLPFIYGLPQIVSLPLMALAGQMAAGRPSPWLPAKLSARSFAIDNFKGVLNRGDKYIGWFERLARPRLGFLLSHTGKRIVGALLFIPCASIAIPLPLTNTVPGIGVTIGAVGLIEKDGLLTLLGLLIGLIWVALLVTVGVEGIQLLKDFVLGLLS